MSADRLTGENIEVEAFAIQTHGLRLSITAIGIAARAFGRAVA